MRHNHKKSSISSFFQNVWAPWFEKSCSCKMIGKNLSKVSTIAHDLERRELVFSSSIERWKTSNVLCPVFVSWFEPTLKLKSGLYSDCLVRDGLFDGIVLILGDCCISVPMAIDCSLADWLPWRWPKTQMFVCHYYNNNKNPFFSSGLTTYSALPQSVPPNPPCTPLLAFRLD